MRKPAEFHAHWMPFPAAPEYRAIIKHIVDGDTVDAYVDLGLYDYAYITVRVAGVDTPEVNSGTAEDKERGRTAKARTSELVLGRPVMLRTYKDTQTFGRFVADIFYRGGDGGLYNLAETLIAEGHVK